jgi:hypothetical protein
VSRLLLAHLCALAKVRIISVAVEEKVRMIGHEHVRSYRERIRARRLQNLTPDEIDDRSVREDDPPFVRATRQVVAVATDVVECLSRGRLGNIPTATAIRQP